MENLGGQNIFSKVDTRSERQRAYTLIIEAREEVQVQLLNKELVRCRPMLLKDSRLILTPIIQPIMSNKEEVIVTFEIGQEKYFLKTTLHRQGHDFYYIDTNNILYKLQRRNSFRVSIPVGYGARVTISEIGDNAAILKLPLADLSSGGFAFESTAHLDIKLTKGDIIRGVIMVGNTFNKSYEAIVRHIASYGSKGSGLTRLGVEFINMSAQDKEAFMKIAMEIHRDMFSTFKIGAR